ncbi:MAG: FitA-like ribbon-helix-helix domain-containing protein [Chthoniobacterales bacterium]
MIFSLPFWNHFAFLYGMPTATLVIKSVPKNVYEYLKESAHAHRRSLTQEVITILEQIMISQKKEKKFQAQKFL